MCKNPATYRHSETLRLLSFSFLPVPNVCGRNVHEKPHLRALKITSIDFGIDFHPILCFIWRTCKEHLVVLLTVLLVKYTLSTFITSIFLLNDDLAKWVILNDDTWGSEVALLLAFRARYHGGVHLVLHSPKGWGLEPVISGLTDCDLWGSGKLGSVALPKLKLGFTMYLGLQGEVLETIGECSRGWGINAGWEGQESW